MTLMTAVVTFLGPDGSVLGMASLTGGHLIGCDIPSGAVTLNLTAVVTSSTASR